MKETDKLYDLLHTLGKKRSIELMSLVRKFPKSYTELQKELGINSKLVSTKLKELIQIQLLKKEGDKYNLSKLGKKIFKKIKPLSKVVAEFTKTWSMIGKMTVKGIIQTAKLKKLIELKT